MKYLYVAMINTVIEFSTDLQANISLIGVFNTEEKAKQAIENYSRYHVKNDHPNEQVEFAEGIAELAEIKRIEIDKMYPDLEFDYQRY